MFVAGNLTDEDPYLVVVSCYNHQHSRRPFNRERIDQLTGLRSKLDEEEAAFKISFPRDDIAVSVDGCEIPAFMGLTTSASFTRVSYNEAMVIADSVLFEDEVNLAMFVALEAA